MFSRKYTVNEEKMMFIRVYIKIFLKDLMKKDYNE